MRSLVEADVDWTWRDRNLFEVDKIGKVSIILVVWSWKAISFAFVHQMAKVEDKTPGSQEKSAQDRDSMANTAGKKVVSKTASK